MAVSAPELRPPDGTSEDAVPAVPLAAQSMSQANLRGKQTPESALIVIWAFAAATGLRSLDENAPGREARRPNSGLLRSQWHPGRGAPASVWGQGCCWQSCGHLKRGGRGTSNRWRTRRISSG